ncbi:2-oxoglutarate and iron-dependent oxygenase domain-containing protein [Brasilonema sp. UFV-L1]|uniref:2-oxoglutarate and iron-dependent oxygenase domain-containing protein n=1 Tax=Brasilonema sp. UFV-L1 TaxID=2234130 RepID=UPI00145E864A|nr:2-oxoglutarate and iron-dependent oxygenase domain-containing protein [Brasilonema sp. UFV-L1]NMG08418.1 hypothetical protein [Brasilonema sp. UFV-L1]
MKVSPVVNEEFSLFAIIDISALVSGTDERYMVASQIGEACRECGFFYIVGHGVDENLQQRLEELRTRNRMKLQQFPNVLHFHAWWCTYFMTTTLKIRQTAEGIRIFILSSAELKVHGPLNSKLLIQKFMPICWLNINLR